MGIKKTQPKNIVITNQITKEKAALARELRRQMTKPEKILWQQLRTNRLNGLHFRRQQVIAGFIVDFYCHKVALAIELDGSIHQQQIENDQERDKALSEIGVRVLRFQNEEVITNINLVLSSILRICKERFNE